jgi:signal transduction histidine kinase
VEALGGTIEAQSPPASGARFFIHLPVTAER